MMYGVIYIFSGYQRSVREYQCVIDELLLLVIYNKVDNNVVVYRGRWIISAQLIIILVQKENN